jgi:biotin carboxyl carrier protein
MARIRILQGVAGDDFSWTPGDEVELADEEAVKWADGYRAEYVTPPAEKPAPKPRAAQPKEAEPREEAAEDAAPAAAEKAAVRSRGGGRGSRTATRGK